MGVIFDEVHITGLVQITRVCKVKGYSYVISPKGCLQLQYNEMLLFRCSFMKSDPGFYTGRY